MTGLAIGLQVLGLVLILIGALKASLQMGALQRWGGGLSGRVRVIWALAAEWWQWHVLRKRPGGASPSTIGATVRVHPAEGSSSGGVAWVNPSIEEQIALLRTDVDGLRGSLNAVESQLRALLEEISGRLAEQGFAIDQRLAVIDSREAEILGWELAGGACSLLGTVLFLVA